MAEIGLNIYQIIQNQLQSKESDRQSLGLGSRLSIIEVKLDNSAALGHNNLISRPHHSIKPLKCMTPESRRDADNARRRLLRQNNRDPHRDPKDPTIFVRDEEVWEVAPHFPRTVLAFKELQFRPDWVRELVEFYNIEAYWINAMEKVDILSIEDVSRNLETCLEELAFAWGVNWARIGGLSLPTQQVS